MGKNTPHEVVLSKWKERPVNAREFAATVPIEGVSKWEVEKIIRKSREYGNLAQGQKSKRSVQRRFINSELRRGSLTFADSAYFRKYFGQSFIMVFIDWYSKYSCFEMMPRLTGKASSAAFERILSRLPFTPQKIVTDRGTEYTSWEFRSMLRRRNIEHILTTETWDNKAQVSCIFFLNSKKRK
ncbi:MAG: transposase family protein [Gammaproteobacteria bacterium]|nr:transposase family protein [Gammaproteobacteria bacterium]